MLFCFHSVDKDKTSDVPKNQRRIQSWKPAGQYRSYIIKRLKTLNEILKNDIYMTYYKFSEN